MANEWSIVRAVREASVPAASRLLLFDLANLHKGAPVVLARGGRGRKGGECLFTVEHSASVFDWVVLNKLE